MGLGVMLAKLREFLSVHCHICHRSQRQESIKSWPLLSFSARLLHREHRLNQDQTQHASAMKLLEVCRYPEISAVRSQQSVSRQKQTERKRLKFCTFV